MPTNGNLSLFTAGGGHVWVNQLKLHTSAPIISEHAQFVNVSEVDIKFYGRLTVILFMRNEGCSKFFIISQ